MLFLRAFRFAGGLFWHRFGSRDPLALLAFVLMVLLAGTPRARAVVLWSDPSAMLVFENGSGRDILEGAVKRDDTANDTLYFRFHIDPQSDSTAEEYFAAFELYEGETERLGVGNALKAWAYSAFFQQDLNPETGPAPDYIDLHSSVLDQSIAGSSSSYEFPRRGVERTVVFKVQFVPGGEDLVTVWLHPDLGPGASEVYQSESLTTRFSANASFDELRLRHGGGGPGWIFSQLAIATAFSDFVDTSSSKPASSGPADDFTAPRLSFQSWQRETGMPRDAIRALGQTRNGYLWLGADDGLARFDGVRFANFDLTSVAGGNQITALLGDAQGALWIGTSGHGLVCYAEHAFARPIPLEGLASTNVTALAEAAGGQIWIGTDTGLRVWQAGAVTLPAELEELRRGHIAALFSDHSGSMWIAVKGEGLFRFDGKALTKVSDPEMDSLLSESHCLLVDKSGRIWVGAGDDFVLNWENGLWRRFRIPRHSATPFVSSLVEQPDGTIWAGSTSEGLFQFKQGKLTAVPPGAGLLDNRVAALFCDRDGHLWVGRDTGLSRLRRDQLFNIGQDEGLGYGAVHGLAEVAPGVVWAVKPNDGLYRWEGRSFSRLTASGLVPRDPFLGSILVTPNGSCWVASTNGLLLFRDPQAVSDESRLFALTNVQITAIAEGVDHSIWAGSRLGELWQLAHGQWRRVTTFPATNGITALATEPTGGLWVGTGGSGLFLWHENVRAHFDSENGLASAGVRTLYLDKTGVLWIGTEGGGLARWRAGDLQSFAAVPGFAEENISQILEDDSGRLWLGGDRGVRCVRKAELLQPLGPSLNAQLLQRYDGVEGAPAGACSTGFAPAGLKMKSGLLWFSTRKGIIVCNPELLPNDSALPEIVVEEVQVDGESVASFSRTSFRTGSDSDPIQVAPGRHRLEFQYTTVCFDSPERLRFRYQLEGWDADWVEAGNRRTAFYNYVPPGEYRFRVAVSNGSKSWNEPDTVLKLFVARHFWQRPWVITVFALGLLAAVGGGVRIVEKRKARRRMVRVEQERALERERHRIAQDLHDEMGAKLCRISFLSEHARRGEHAESEVRQQVSTIADASRELLHTLDEIVWAVNPRNDTLEHLASYINQYAQNYFQGTGVACELMMPDQFEPHPVSSAVRHQLFLAVHEAFTNVLKHAAAKRTKVVMHNQQELFIIQVEDDGKGFDTTAGRSGETGGDCGADGLRNMKERLASVGGRCEIESTPGHGTSIRFILPLKPTGEFKEGS